MVKKNYLLGLHTIHTRQSLLIGIMIHTMKVVFMKLPQHVELKFMDMKIQV